MNCRQIWLMTMAATQDLSGIPIFFNYSSAIGTVYYLNLDNPVPMCPNSCVPQHEGRRNIQRAGDIRQLIIFD